MCIGIDSLIFSSLERVCATKSCVTVLLMCTRCHSNWWFQPLQLE